MSERDPEESEMEQVTQEWRVGGIRVVRVFESEIVIPIDLLFGEKALAVVGDAPWLRATGHVTADGQMRISVHAFAIDDGERKIVVDTCAGNHKERTSPYFAQLDTPFLQQLTAAGFPPDEVDVVLCTHLHVDHVGWNTRLVDGVWRPTFPRARYLLAATEWEHVQAVPPPPDDDLVADSVQPLFDAGLVDLVAMDHRVAPGVRLAPTPGHTPGHVVVELESQGRRAVITGDLIHHPVQVAAPELITPFDHDEPVATRTRIDFLHHHHRSGALVLGTHFGTPTAGFLEGDDSGALRLEPAPTIDQDPGGVVS